MRALLCFGISFVRRGKEENAPEFEEGATAADVYNEVKDWRRWGRRRNEIRSVFVQVSGNETRKVKQKQYLAA